MAMLCTDSAIGVHISTQNDTLSIQTSDSQLAVQLGATC